MCLEGLELNLALRSWGGHESPACKWLETAVESPRVPGLTADFEAVGWPGWGSEKRCQGPLSSFLKKSASESVGCMF